ncbi:MAG: hypothetical protein ABEK04_00135 [Candidatus Nanohalobium sp.]
MKRRDFMKGAGAAAFTAFAGCAGSNKDEMISQYSFEVGEALDFAYGEPEETDDEIEVTLEETDNDRARFSVRYNIGGFKEGLYASGTDFWLEKGEETELTEKLVENYNLAWEMPGKAFEELDTKEKLEKGPEQYISLGDVSKDSAEAYFTPEIFPTDDKHYE